MPWHGNPLQLTWISVLRTPGINLSSPAYTACRPWALQRGLAEINREIERASRSGVACWFPMGTRNERIVRLPVQEASILNSRSATLTEHCKYYQCMFS